MPCAALGFSLRAVEPREVPPEMALQMKHLVKSALAQEEGAFQRGLSQETAPSNPNTSIYVHLRDAAEPCG